ncbi:MAG: glutamine amidotransferase, partial [Pseudorhodoplanes sp.]
MCGIVGLFTKDRSLEPELGRLMAQMLVAMTDRGPDSTGFAVYGGAEPGEVKLTIRGPAGTDFVELTDSLASVAAPPLAVHDNHAVIAVAQDREAEARDELSRRPNISVVSFGRSMEVFKEVGLPSEVSKRFGLASMRGSHGIGHTRMATESAVTTQGAHPFTTGMDECLVHNGSLSNHNQVRRGLIRQGLSFQTDNDSEVAAGYLTWKMREGATLTQALESSLDALDGFDTFVVGTETGFGVLRD